MVSTPNYTAEQVKDAVNKLTKGKFKNFGSILDVASFIWDVVNDIMDTFNDKNLTLQQKEDVAMGISRCVVSELQSKNLIDKELAEKIIGLINSADSFLDILISVYTTVTTKNIVNIACGWFGFKCCSKKSKVEIPISIKVEEVKTEEVKTEEVKTEEVKTEEIPPLEIVLTENSE
jgi:hypothetical protein